MSWWNRILAALRKKDGAPRESPDKPSRPAPPARPPPPTLAEMRERLRPGMSHDEFFATLDEIVVERGLRMSMPTNDKRVIALPVAEGGELLCFLPDGVLTYVEYKGGVFLEL